MQNLKFKQLLILSNTEKKASRFEFKKNKILIISKDENNAGKTTLVKLLLWGIGCEPFLDQTWKKKDCKTIIEFSIREDENYLVYRYKNQISIKRKEDSAPPIFYDKIGGAYSILLAKLLKFNLRLPQRDKDVWETPTPTYYFIPSYIDQKRSWSNAWDNFDKLGQYKDWIRTTIGYHTGLYTSRYFELQEKKGNKIVEQEIIQQDIKETDIMLTRIKKYIPFETNSILEKKDIENLVKSINQKATKLKSRQEELFSQIVLIQTEKTNLESQKELSQHAIKELEADYIFTVENIGEDSIECPLCGTYHSNTILDRSAILIDKNQAIEQLAIIEKELDKINSRLEKVNKELSSIKEEISKMDNTYIEYNNNSISEIDAIELIAANNIRHSANIEIGNNVIKVDSINTEIKRLIKEIKKHITKEDKEKNNNIFQTIFSDYRQILNVDSFNNSNINSPFDYKKIAIEGGGAENARAMFAYYLTIYTMSLRSESEIKIPLIIDTPNQQEQASFNYKSMIELIMSQLTPENQIFICAIDNKALDKIKKEAQVIELTEKDRLFKKNIFEKAKEEFSKF